jgi:C1A family cysteine protease
MGVNQFTGMTDEEFAAAYLTPRKTSNAHSEKVTINAIIGDVDWVAQGKVSGLKNQGNCGSCWAFSAVAVLESWALFKGQTVNLSEQQLVDCSHSYGNNGCNGGLNYKGLAYVKDHGLTTTSAYPYTAKTQTCQTQGGSFKISGVTTVKGCASIQTAIQSHPIGVSADATNWSRYSSGIFSNCAQSINHDIQLVGYTSSYYTIKNSWGATWGEKGFIRLAPGNTCGICNDPSPWVS